MAYKNYDRENTLIREQSTYRCKCGHRIPYSVFNKHGWTICKVCLKKVYNPSTEFKNKLKERLRSDK